MLRNVILYVLVLSGYFSFAQDSVQSNGWSIKIDLYGSFLKTMGPILSNEEITTFHTSGWYLPGFDISKRIHHHLEAGINLTPSYGIFIEEIWGLSSGPLDGNLELNYRTPLIVSTYFKYYPFNNGLNISLALQYLSKENYQMAVDPINGEHLVLGNQIYPGSASGSWNFKSAWSLAFGLQYDISLSNKILLGLGMQVPIISSPYYENISITLDSGDDIQTEDLEMATQRVKDEIFYYPVQFRIQFGLEL